MTLVTFFAQKLAKLKNLIQTRRPKLLVQQEDGDEGEKPPNPEAATAELEIHITFIIFIWLVVSTYLKNISQLGNLTQIGMKVKNIWNHHLDIFWYVCTTNLGNLFYIP